MYELIVMIHVLSAFAWVGGGFTLILGARNIKAAEGQASVDRMVGSFEKTTNLIFSVAPPLVLLTGLAQVAMNDAWKFSQLWIIVAISLFVVVAIMGGAIGGRYEKQMRRAREEGRSIPDVFDRWMRLTWVEMVVLVGIVALMVFKPL